jgi:hypothetical protein
MSGSAKWTRDGDDEWTADIIRSVRNDNKLNIVFETLSDGTEGRISLHLSSDPQTVEGFFAFPNIQQQNHAVVNGRLTSFNSNEFEFEGTWDDGEGAPWIFHLEVEPDQ